MFSYWHAYRMCSDVECVLYTEQECKVEIDKESLPAKDDPVSPCAGGVKMFNADYMISVDNTLNGRMDVVLAQKMPDIKIMLFGRSATRTHLDTDM